MKTGSSFKLILAATLVLATPAFADITVKKVNADVKKEAFDEKMWMGADDTSVSLMAQPMALPRPSNSETSSLKVAAVHDGKWIAFRVKWTAPEAAEGGKLGTFSDAVAIQFPVKSNESPPPIMMGAKDNPVHIFHWRYMYQIDAEKGMKTIEKIYPNMTTDMYAHDFKVKGNFKEADQANKDAFIGGKAAGNPQSFAKSGVDEIFAEGFGTSAVIENPQSVGKGVWKEKQWTVIIVRPLRHEGGSTLEAGKSSFVSFAVWQGAKKEVGARKCVTMSWTPLTLQGANSVSDAGKGK